jgi:hypothetical protein
MVGWVGKSSLEDWATTPIIANMAAATIFTSSKHRQLHDNPYLDIHTLIVRDFSNILNYSFI